MIDASLKKEAFVALKSLLPGGKSSITQPFNPSERKQRLAGYPVLPPNTPSANLLLPEPHGLRLLIAEVSAR